MASWSVSGHGGRTCIMAVMFVTMCAASTVHSRSSEEQDLKLRVGVRRFSRASMMSDFSLQAAPGGRSIADELFSDCDHHSGCGESSDRICCNRKCVDVSRSSQSCGACNVQCAYNKECCGGVCVDAHASDPFNCGACGNVCADGVPCLFGMCGYSSGRIIP
ncbi:hypothetical protein M758_5G068600 [Ceratodon purpureus]|nr:hypothetical protein M758_5G068600 [Ceratodon purpureus]